MRGIGVSANDKSKFELSKKLGALLAAVTAFFLVATNITTGTVISGVSSGTADEMKAVVQTMIDQDKEIEAMLTPEEHNERLEAEIARRARNTFVDTTIRKYGEDIAEIKDTQKTFATNQTEMQELLEYATDKIEDIATVQAGAAP